ncbi:hypothetical protein ACFLY9_01320 [Patescibacteria group bacterium]
MSKVKYISLEDLQISLSDVIEDVFKYDTNYIVMVDKEPKVRISSLIDGKTGKKITVEEDIDEEKLKEFIKD